MIADSIVIRVLWQDGLPPVGMVVDVFDSDHVLHRSVYRRSSGGWGTSGHDGAASLADVDVVGWRLPLRDTRQSVMQTWQAPPLTEVLPEGSE